MLQQRLSSSQNSAALAPDPLIKASLPLVRKIAWQVHARVPSSVERDDLVEVGTIALVEAAQSYEDRGHAFATYAALRIRGAMIDYLRKEARMARSAIARRRTVEAMRGQLEQKLCRAPHDGEMAAALGLTLPAYRETVLTIQPPQNEPIEDAYSDQMMVFADPSDLPDEMLVRTQMANLLQRALGQLKPREQTILHLYFAEGLNLEEIGERLGVGAARVCQIKRSALSKMRDMMGEMYC